jgi:hypothetical protein
MIANVMPLVTVFKKYHLPLTLQSGYSSTQEEEKVMDLIIKTFPSFFKGEVYRPKSRDGVVLITLYHSDQI